MIKIIKLHLRNLDNSLKNEERKEKNQNQKPTPKREATCHWNSVTH